MWFEKFSPLNSIVMLRLTLATVENVQNVLAITIVYGLPHDTFNQALCLREDPMVYV